MGTLSTLALFVAWANLAYQLDHISDQIWSVGYQARIETAELLNHNERARDLLEEWREARAEKKKAKRQFWITWGVIALVAGLWWLYKQ